MKLKKGIMNAKKMKSELRRRTNKADEEIRTSTLLGKEMLYH